MSEALRQQTQTILRRFAARLIEDAPVAALSSEQGVETVLALVEKACSLGDIDTAARLLEHFGPRLGRESHLERLDACLAAALAAEGLFGERQVNLADRRVQVLTSLGQRAEAEAVLGNAWPHAQTPLARSRLYNRQGYLLASYEEYALARQSYQAALVAAQAAGNQQQVVILYNNLGEMAFTGEAYDEALSCFAQALAAARSLSDPYLHGLIEGGMAMTLDALLRFDEANDHHEAGRRGYQEAGDSLGLTRIDLNQAYNAIMRGDFDAAIELAGRALAAARRSGNSHHLAMAHQHLGAAYLQTENYELAWESLAQALALRLHMGKPVYIETTLSTIQRLMDALGERPASSAHASLLLRCQKGLEAAQVALAPASNPPFSQPPPPPPVPLPFP